MARDQVRRETSGAVRKHPFQGRTEARLLDLFLMSFFPLILGDASKVGLVIRPLSSADVPFDPTAPDQIVQSWVSCNPVCPRAKIAIVNDLTLDEQWYVYHKTRASAMLGKTLHCKLILYTYTYNLRV